MKKNAVNLIFVLCALLFLLASLGKALLRPKDMNYYENRYAERIPAVSLSTWLDGSFQDGAESGLNDQVPGAQKLKKLYHLTFSFYQKLIARPLAERMPDRYVDFGTVRHFGSHFCNYALDMSDTQYLLDNKIDNYNDIFAAEPDTEFFVYYMENDTDFDFETGEKPAKVYEHLRRNLNLPQDHIACYEVDGYEQYASRFYQTDHHWNHVGSYEGYKEMLAMTAPGEAPLEPLGVQYLGTVSGSKASGRERICFSEPFYAYRFDFPAMEVTADGGVAEDYGQQSRFLAGEGGDLSYGAFYGFDSAFASLHVPENEGKENLLLLGDSFDNAVVKLLASHFANTYAVDLRYYESCFGQEFLLGDFLERYDIDKVLISGSRSCFFLEDFLLED